MAKNHRLHNRPKQQSQTAAMSPPHAYGLDADEGSSLSLATPTDDQDDDDICPVCESECTCDNRRSRPNFTSFISHSSPPYGSVGVASSESQPRSAVSAPKILKIKLTLPPSMQAKHQSSKAASQAPPVSKQHKSHSKVTPGVSPAGGSLTVKAIGSPFSAPGQPLVPSGSGYQVDTNGNPIKKRGRPSKADLAARAVARAAEAAAQGVDISQNVLDSRLQNAQSSRGRTTQKRSTNKRPLKKKANGSRRTKIAPWEVSSSSESNGVHDHDDYDTRSISFPTFISTSSHTSMSSSDSDSDSDEERYPHNLPESSHENILTDMDERQTRKRRHRNNDWEIRPRQKSIGAEEEADVSEGDDGSEEEDEKEGEADEEGEDVDEDELDPSVAGFSYAGVATGWSDEDEESIFDAELFFANLSDTSADVSDSQVDDDIKHGDEDTEMEMDADVNMDALSLSEVAAAGFLGTFEQVGSRGLESLLFEGDSWDRQFMFADSLKEGQGVLDLAFEASAAQLRVDANMVRPSAKDVDVLMSESEEEGAVAILDVEGEAEEIIYDDADGETTEDELVDLDGVPTPRNLLLFQFPTSLSSINPQSTMSPIMSSDPDKKALAARKHEHRGPPKPADILAGKVFPMDEVSSLQIPASEAPSPTVSSQLSGKCPEMGAFEPRAADTTRKVIVTASTTILPSPFPAVRRLRKRSTSRSGTKRSRSGSDVLSLTSTDSRSSSFLAAQRSPYHPIYAAEFFGEPDDPPTEPMSLQDVLEAAFLESDPPSDLHDSEMVESEANGSDADLKRHLKHLTLWNFIPMDTFRRTRTSGAVGVLEDTTSITPWLGSSSRAPQPADGICYGSPAGGMMRDSPFSSTLWDSQSRRKGEGKRNGKSDMRMSPVILPLRDGDRTPTNNYHTRNDVQQRLFGRAQNIKSRKELRKEKKRNRKMFNAAAAHQRQHFPNMKSRSSGSIQRSKYSSSPMPSFSL